MTVNIWTTLRSPEVAIEVAIMDTLYMNLIKRDAQAEGMELKDVVNLSFHTSFERRYYQLQER